MRRLHRSSRVQLGLVVRSPLSVILLCVFAMPGCSLLFDARGSGAMDSDANSPAGSCGALGYLRDSIGTDDFNRSKWRPYGRVEVGDGLLAFVPDNVGMAVSGLVTLEEREMVDSSLTMRVTVPQVPAELNIKYLFRDDVLVVLSVQAGRCVLFDADGNDFLLDVASATVMARLREVGGELEGSCSGNGLEWQHVGAVPLPEGTPFIELSGFFPAGHGESPILIGDLNEECD